MIFLWNIVNRYLRRIFVKKLFLVGLFCLLFSSVGFASTPEVIQEDMAAFLKADQALDQTYEGRKKERAQKFAEAKTLEQQAQVVYDYQDVSIGYQMGYRKIKVKSDEMKALLKERDRLGTELTKSVKAMYEVKKSGDLASLKEKYKAVEILVIQTGYMDQKIMAGGYYDDPLKGDIQDFLCVDAMVNTKYGTQFMNDLKRKASTVKTPEEFEVVVAEFKVVLADIQKQYAGLKPKSEEMKPLVSKIYKAMGDMSASMDEVVAGVRAQDKNMLNTASEKMMKAIKDVNDAENAVIQLGNNKGMKINKK